MKKLISHNHPEPRAKIKPAMPAYRPPCTISAPILRLVEEIGEWIGRCAVKAETALTPRLRRGNRLRTVQASLEIENNTLTLEQVTAVIEGRRVLGPPREIQEVRNAFAAYEAAEKMRPESIKDLLKAHSLLTTGLVDNPGRFRAGSVGIMRGRQLIHAAPPASRVPQLVGDLLGWLGRTDVHPLVAGGIFHYEIEFIHPFMDGNGRLGRLWQTLILSRWRKVFAYLPVETIIRDRQKGYYHALSTADGIGDSAPFVQFMLEAILEALKDSGQSDQVGDQVSDQVKILLKALADGRARTALDLMKSLRLSHRHSFRMRHLRPAIQQGLVEMLVPEKPNSRMQKYRLTEKGRNNV